MRFIALVKKELRVIMPYLIPVTILFVLLGIYVLPRPDSQTDYYGIFTLGRTGSFVVSYELIPFPTPWTFIGMVCLIYAIISGLCMAGQHFWEENKLKTWAFTIHRSVKRSTILWAKLAAAVMAFIIFPGFIWILFYLYVSKLGGFAYRPPMRVFAEGWIFISLGFIVYLGTALSIISVKKWYTTKLFGLVFAGGICVLALMQRSLAPCLAVIIIGLVMSLSQVVSVFLNREF